MHRFLLVLALLAPTAALADSNLPFMKELAGDHQLPPPWGIGLDFYTMNQDYRITDLQFQYPGVSLPDPSQIAVTNEIQHFDLKGDVWLLPFLNVFAVLGHVRSDTVVDLSGTAVVGLPFPLGKLPISTNGTVYGGGATVAFGGDKWFAAVTSTWTHTDLGGDFDSSADTLTAQPRIGLIRGQWVGWVGAMYLDVEEKHSGSIDLPYIGRVPFAVVLDTRDKWNTVAGFQHYFGEHASLSLEIGFGNRTHTLFNFTYRF